MKKISILTLPLLVAMGFAACDDIDVVQPSVNLPEPAMDAGSVAVTPTSQLEAASIDLNDYNDADASIPVLRLEQLENLPAGTDLQMVMEISPAQDFAAKAVVPTAFDGDMFTVDPDDMQAALIRLFGYEPVARQAYVRIYGNVVSDLSTVRLGGPDFYYFPAAEKTLVPVAEFAVEEAYYLVYGSKSQTPDKGEAFVHAADTDIWNDPNFRIVVNISDDDLAAAGGTIYWKIVSKTAYDYAKANGGAWIDAPDAVYGPESDGSDGALVSTDAPYGEIKETGGYEFSVNLQDLTYNVRLLVADLIVRGDATGWDSTWCLLHSDDYVNYSGFAPVKGGFKLTGDADWGHGNYGGSNGLLVNSSSSPNIPVETDGLYWITANTVDMTYTATLITSIDIFGNGNVWPPAEGSHLTPSDDWMTWSGDVDFTNTPYGWKIACNGNWGIDFGGTIDALVRGGGNIAAPSPEGVYTMTLDLTSQPYKATLVPAGN
ncbi:MAG: hypothetical protein K2L49_02810 [Muribaculaceae bacterium]|nr:hypothetical protein [Muribaculaceae bacterium]